MEPVTQFLNFPLSAPSKQGRAGFGLGDMSSSDFGKTCEHAAAATWYTSPKLLSLSWVLRITLNFDFQ
eukprot:1160948-Pelagomonas_calceolata.AAC.3